jgi:mono/diheme cytochrome c family protein
MTQVRHRSAGLLTILTLALLLIACGRATDQEIDQALGITPTATADPTISAEETAAAEAAAASPGGSETVAVTGNATLGKSKYSFTCAVCHRAGGGGSAPDLTDAGGPGATLTLETLTSVVRDGEGHPPGPYETFEVTDSDIANILAFLLGETTP